MGRVQSYELHSLLEMMTKLAPGDWKAGLNSHSESAKSVM